MSDIGSNLTDRRTLEVETFDWGVLQWLCDGRLIPGAQQTVGWCRIEPGRRNPVHYHPNCEEVLVMLAGHGWHRLGDDYVELHAGMTLRIPTGIVHGLENIGAEPLECVIAFSSGDRQTVFLETA